VIDFPIIDSHVHFWNPANPAYAWLADAPALNRQFLPADYRTAAGQQQVDGIVFIECDSQQPQAEADWVTSLAADEPRIQGIVAQAAIENGAAVKDELAQLANNYLVKGIRRLIQSEPDPEFCIQPQFVSGVQLLAEFSLSFDLCIYHHQLANTTELVKQCPEVQFVLDHIGKPNIREQQFDPWKEQLTTLSELPNVACKVSGLVTEADMENWQPEDLRPYIAHVLEQFGFPRVMFGGDWPVVTLAGTLDRWMALLWSEVQGCSEHERRQLFHDNAIEFYRLRQ
jgi:L-fuconolactonase